MITSIATAVSCAAVAVNGSSVFNPCVLAACVPSQLRLSYLWSRLPRFCPQRLWQAALLWLSEHWMHVHFRSFVVTIHDRIDSDHSFVHSANDNYSSECVCAGCARTSDASGASFCELSLDGFGTQIHITSRDTESCSEHLNFGPLDTMKLGWRI